MEKNKKEKVPKHLEAYLSEYIILYTDPYIVFNQNTKKYELKMTVPYSEYYINKFKTFYKLNEDPDPNTMLEILNKDTLSFMQRLNEKTP